MRFQVARARSLALSIIAIIQAGLLRYLSNVYCQDNLRHYALRARRRRRRRLCVYCEQ